MVPREGLPTDPSATLDRLLELVTRCAGASDPDQVLAAALPALATISGADETTVVPPSDDPSDDLPACWADAGVEHVEQHALPGHTGVLLLGWRVAPSLPDEVLAAALAVVDAALAHRLVEAEHADLRARVDNAQHLANMGDYDWHIASDTNRWSDQLYRIYGHEPQSFNASYDRFLEMVHPDDRDLVTAVHREAYATGEPYQMVERIVRPDGEVRHLASNGQVLRDAHGTPLRFRGTCIDITDRVVAEQDAEEIASRMAEDRLRQRQALELNDSVVQGLVAASYALQLDDLTQASVHVDRTLAAARGMLDDLLQPRDGSAPAPGDLVRSAPATPAGGAP